MNKQIIFLLLILCTGLISAQGLVPPLVAGNFTTNTFNNSYYNVTSGNATNWINLTSINLTQMENSGGVLNILESWISSLSVNRSNFWDNLNTPADIDLGDLGDVNAPAPSNENILSYDSGISNWISITISTLHTRLLTFFYNKTQIDNNFYNITQTEERYYNKTDFNSNGVGHMVYTKTVDGNNVTMSTII